MKSAVQSAITQYNQASAITLLTCSTPPAVLNTASTGVVQAQITTIQAAKSAPALYALGTDAQGKNGKVYQINSNSLLPVTSLPLPPTTAQVIAMTGNGTQLVLLSSSPSGASQSYALSMYLPGQKKASASVPVNVENTYAPTFVTASGADVYVVATSSASTTIFVQDYHIAQGKLDSKPAVETLTAANVVSVAAFPRQQLFFLLADGSIHSLQFTSGSGAFTSVFVPRAIPSPLATGSVSAATFTAQTPVPVASPTSDQGLQALSIGASTTSSLVASQVGTEMHLYVMDTYAHRLLDFTEDTTTSPSSAGATPTAGNGSAGTGGGAVGTGTATTSSMTLTPVAQYIAPTAFVQLKSMTATPDGSDWYVLTQNASAMLTMIQLHTKAGMQATC